jgi:tripartite-type tricarboxylate transporter receptor subunit TctC
MTLTRRHFLRLSAGVAVLPRDTCTAQVQAYPSRPLRIVAGFPPGTATDIDARLIAQWLSGRLGQQVVVDNRPGAGSNIAAEEVIRSPPDGYTLLMVTVTNAVNVTLYHGLSFDFARDIAPVAGTMRTANVLVVHPSVPAKTVPEFIAYAKAHPGKVNYASGGHGSAPNMAAELFKMMASVDLVHVPYRGSTIPDLLAGQVEAEFTPIPLSIGYIRDGKLRPLAVTSTTRSDALPDVPAMAEFVPGYVADVWHGIGAPRRTPADIIGRLNKEINAILADPTLKERFAQLGAAPMPMTADELGKFISEEIDKWGKVVKFAGIKPG